MGSSGKVIHKSEQQKKGNVGERVNREMCIKQFNTSFVAATAICIWKSHREHCKLVVVHLHCDEHSDAVCISCPSVQSPNPPNTKYVVFYTTYIFFKKRKEKKTCFTCLFKFCMASPGLPCPRPCPGRLLLARGSFRLGEGKNGDGGVSSDRTPS